MRRHAIISVLLGLVTLALFAPALKHDFISFDDPVYITSNADVQRGLSWENFKWALSSTAGGNYWHPVTWLSHEIDCQLYGLKPWGHHLTSIAIHSANTALVVLALAAMTGSIGRSFIVAALFGWHPLRVESVAWVAERKDVLSTFFWLLMLLAYVKFTRERKNGGNRAGIYYGLSLAMFALGLMSKPMVVTAPCVLLLLDYWPLGRVEPKWCSAANRRLMVEKAPFFTLAAIISIAAYIVQKNGGAIVTDISPAGRFENAAVSYCRYIGKTIWPSNMAIFYPHPGHWPFLTTAAAATALAFITLAALALARKAPYLIVGWLWFLGVLVPTIGIIQAGAQAMADRYSYVPSIGLYIMAAWGIADIVAAMKRPGFIQPVLAALALAGCATVMELQLACWKNSETLFRHTVAVTNNNYLALTSLADYLAVETRHPAAGIGYFYDALKIKSDYAPAHLGLGYALWEQGKLADAEKEFAATLELTPLNVETRLRYARILAQESKLDDADRQLHQILDLDPGHIEARFELAQVLTREHDPSDAAVHYREILREQPDQTEALNNLAWLLATCPKDDLRDGSEAVRLAEKARQLTHDSNAMIIGTLAAAYAEAGRFDDAIKAGEKARQLALAQSNAALAETNRLLIESYRAHRACRESAPNNQR